MEGEFRQCPNGHYYQGNECPYCEKQPKIDKKTALYQLEYKLLPLYVEYAVENQDGITKLCDISIWERDIEKWLHASRLIDWDEISCEVLGDNETESIIVYEFSLPFDVPLAKYGAVYINRQKHICRYYTLERSFGGYMLCSPTSNGHANLGSIVCESKEEFVKKISTVIGIDDLVLEKRTVIKRKFTVADFGNLIELTDNNYNEFIANSSFAVVCFYGIFGNVPSRVMLPILSEITTAYSDKIKVGIYDVYGIDNEKVMASHNIRYIPTLLFIKDGIEVKHHIGVCRKEDLRIWFEELLRKDDGNINSDINASVFKQCTNGHYYKGDKCPYCHQLEQTDNVIKTITIGRAPDDDYIVDDYYVTRCHCIMEKMQSGKYRIENLGENGTYVNGQRIDSKVVLRKNDVIVIGKTEIPNPYDTDVYFGTSKESES